MNLQAPKDPLSGRLQARDAEELLEVFSPDQAALRGKIWHGCQYWTPRPVKDLVLSMNYRRIHGLARKFKHVNRLSFLKILFEKLTDGASGFRDIYTRVHCFLAEALHHSFASQPVLADGTYCFDPVLLYLLGQGRCGHVARFAADLFTANGFEARVWGLSGHSVAEIRDGQQWAVLDADVYRGINIPELEGELASVKEWSQSPYELDVWPAYVYPPAYTEGVFHQFPELREPYAENLRNVIYPSSGYFAARNEADVSFDAFVLQKKEFDKSGMDFGWDTAAQHSVSLPAVQLRRRPSCCWVLTREGDQMVWPESLSYKDSSAVEYEVVFADKTRGWAYGEFFDQKQYSVFNSENAITARTQEPRAKIPYLDRELWCSVRPLDSEHPKKEKVFIPWSEEYLILPEKKDRF